MIKKDLDKMKNNAMIQFLPGTEWLPVSDIKPVSDDLRDNLNHVD